MSRIFLFDAHTHVNLSPLYEAADEIIQSAKSVGLLGMCVSGIFPGEDWGKIESLAAKYSDFVIPQFGLHPCWISNYDETLGTCNNANASSTCTCCSDVPRLSNLCRTCNQSSTSTQMKWSELLVTALLRTPHASVGECGLDKRIKKQVSLEIQETILKEHLNIALAYSRGITIHCVGAWGRLLTLLQNFVNSHRRDDAQPCSLPFIILHSCNNMPIEMIQPFSHITNLYFSVSGKHTVSDKEVAVIKSLPSSHLLLETDAPDQLSLSLEAEGYTHNEPSLLYKTCQVVADIRGMRVEELATQTLLNSQRIFPFEIPNKK